jgi:hypothetical protein
MASRSLLPASPRTKPPTSSTSEMLSPSEIEQLRQCGRDMLDYAGRAFSKMAEEERLPGQRRHGGPEREAAATSCRRSGSAARK